MPEIDGFEYCEMLRKDPRTKDIPVIFITGLTSTEDKIRGFKLGAVDFIVKPFEIEEVTMRIGTHLKNYRMQQELEEKVIETSAGGGKVKVEMKGTKEIIKLTIDPEIVDPEDTEMLEDLVMVAVNDAIKQIEATAEEGMSSITGGLGLNIPGLF